MSTLQHDRIKALAAELKLTALPDIYGAIAQSAAKKNDASYADFLEEVLRAERDARRVRAREMLTRTAGFPAHKTLEAYDFAFATGARRTGPIVASPLRKMESDFGDMPGADWSSSSSPGFNGSAAFSCVGSFIQRTSLVSCNSLAS